MLYYFELVMNARNDISIARRLGWVEWDELSHIERVTEPPLEFKEDYYGIVAYLTKGRNIDIDRRLFRMFDIVLIELRSNKIRKHDPSSMP